MGVQGLLEDLILIPVVLWDGTAAPQGTGSGLHLRASRGCSVGTGLYGAEECGDQGRDQCLGLGWRGGLEN